MNTQQNNLKVALEKFAQTDLRLARKHGRIAIAQTLVGTLELEYAGGLYKVTANDGQVLAHAKAGVVSELIASLYTVEVA